MPIGLQVYKVLYPGEAAPFTEATIHRCSVSSSVDGSGLATVPSDAQFTAFARSTLERDQRSEEIDGPPHPGCTSLEQVLPGFAQPATFTGVEYADPGDPLGPDQIDAMLAGSPTQKAAATDYVLAHLDAVNPFSLIVPMQVLIERGDMLQASFLFYFWQIRSAPWARHGSADGEGALRGAINSMLGEAVNRWIGSDPEAMVALAERAIAFERRLPLFGGRPESVSAAAWTKTVAELRADYEKGFRQYAPLSAEAKRAFAETRRQNGLPNGPLQNSGKPLPEAWR